MHQGAQQLGRAAGPLLYCAAYDALDRVAPAAAPAALLGMMALGVTVANLLPLPFAQSVFAPGTALIRHTVA